MEINNSNLQKDPVKRIENDSKRIHSHRGFVITIAFILCLVIFTVITISVVQSYNDNKPENRMTEAKSLFKNGQIKEAMVIFKELADSFDYKPAIKIMGLAYTDKTPIIKQNYKKGIAYLTEIADSDTIALDRLMDIYTPNSQFCQGKYSNPKKCRFYANLAISRNQLLRSAYFNLGQIEVDEYDYFKAYYNYTKSANYGEPSAFDNIGWMYFNGFIGKKKDDKYEPNLGIYGDQPEYWPNYIKARKNFEAALNLYSDDDYALYYLGKIYAEGLGIPQNKQKAIKLLEKSANLGNEDAKELYSELTINNN